MKPILVIRFSSLGDVSLTIPVFKALEQQLPKQQFILLSQPAFAPLFQTMNNVTFFGADIYSEFKGISGIFKLHNHLMELDFDHVIDLHNVLRSKVLTLLFKLKGKKVTTYDKQRNLKRNVIAGRNINRRILHTTEQYLAAFKHLDDQLSIPDTPILNPVPNTMTKRGKWIALSPFSKHLSKEWPLNSMSELIHELSLENNTTVFCLAFSQREKSICNEWKKESTNLKIIDDTYDLEEQLGLISKMDALISMDSANMHLASLLGVRVISLWGPTHPSLGFSPLGNQDGIVLSPLYDEPSVRPLSVYGKLTGKNLKAGRSRMEAIDAATVYSRLNEIMAN